MSAVADGLRLVIPRIALAAIARPAGIVRPLPLTVLQRAGRVERCRTTGGDAGGEQRDDGKDDRDGPEHTGDRWP